MKPLRHPQAAFGFFRGRLKDFLIKFRHPLACEAKPGDGQFRLA